jgi:hypothetical protein
MQVGSRMDQPAHLCLFFFNPAKVFLELVAVA